MDFILPLILSLASFVVIITIIARKFRQLRLIDVDSLPEVKNSQKKNEYLRKRAEAKTSELHETILGSLQPFGKKLKIVKLNFRNYVNKIERQVIEVAQKKRRTPVVSQTERDHEVRRILHEAKYAHEAHELQTAEKQYISAITLDERNVEAYQGLAGVYRDQKQFEEAKQTYRFVLYLDKTNEHALLQLAQIAEEEGKLEAAVDYYQQAVLLNDNNSTRFAKLYDLLIQLRQYGTALEAIRQAVSLEPQNPKYLDNLIEASILVGDKLLAEEGLQQLRMVNPENQKLAVFRERIHKLPSAPTS